MKRWMMFVDGENLAIQARKQDGAQSLSESEYHTPDVFVWAPIGKRPLNFLPQERHNTELASQLSMLLSHPVRAYYYTSVYGNDQEVQATRKALWELGFQPRVFKKIRRDVKAKGVDIALATDMLSNAFLDNYDAAVLLAGDGDYCPIVDEVKHLGKQVYVCFFHGPDSGLSPELKLASDEFVDIGYGFFAAHRRLQSK